MNELQSEFNRLQSLDQAVLGQLHEDMGEDVQEVLDAFLESIDDLLTGLKNRTVDDNDEANSRRAHSIKSSAASIGMMKLSGIAAYLEKMLKQSRPVDIDDLVSQMESEFIRGCNMLGVCRT